VTDDADPAPGGIAEQSCHGILYPADPVAVVVGRILYRADPTRARLDSSSTDSIICRRSSNENGSLMVRGLSVDPIRMQTVSGLAQRPAQYINVTTVHRLETADKDKRRSALYWCS
jgi:hypothetical protein